MASNVNTISFGPMAAMPDLQSQQLQLQRAQQMADMLRKESVTPIEAQTVTGAGPARVVPISPLQGLAKLGQAYFANKMQDANDQKQIDLGAEMKKRYVDELKKLAPAGTFDDVALQAAVGQLGSGTMDAVSPPNGAPVIPSAPQSQVDPATKQAWARALAAMQINPELGNKLMENAATLTPEQKNNAAMGINPQMMGRALMAKAVKEGRMEAQPGNTIIDPITLKPLYTAPDFKTGTQGGFVNGQPVMGRIAGSEVIPQMAGETKRAEAGAQAAFDMVTVNTPNGPVMVTREQAVRMAGGGMPNQPASTGAQGLDLSKLSPEQQAYLAKTNPEAFSSGVADFQRTGMQAPQAPQPTPAAGIPLEDPVDQERRKMALGINKDTLSGQVKDADAQRGILNTLDTVESLIRGGTLGNSPKDRLEMMAHSAGVRQTPETIRTANLEKLGNQLVLARGSLGAGVSVADAERYDKAAGDLSTAKSNAERLEYIKIMRDIASRSFANTNNAVESFTKTGTLPPYQPQNSNIDDLLKKYGGK